MFKVILQCKDIHLGKILAAIQGTALAVETIHTVVEAVVEAKPPSGATDTSTKKKKMYDDAFLQCIGRYKLNEPIRSVDIGTALKEAGLRPGNLYGLINRFIREKHLKQTAPGIYRRIK